MWTRVKDSLRRRGDNVSSAAAETVVMTYPAIVKAAAVTVPSELGADDILVVVTLRPGAINAGPHEATKVSDARIDCSHQSMETTIASIGNPRRVPR